MPRLRPAFASAVAVLAGVLVFAAPAGAALTPGVPSFTSASSIAVGQQVAGVAFSPDGATAYASDSETGAVFAIDTATSTVTTSFGAGLDPWPLVVSPDGRTLYADDTDDAEISVINLANDSTTTTLDTVADSYGLALSPDGTRLYVPLAGSDTVSVIDTATDTAIATIPVGDGPWAVAVSPDGGTLYVANEGSDTISVVNTATETVEATIAVGVSPAALAVSPDGSTLYVANDGSDTVSVIDTANHTVTATIAVGSSPDALAVAPDGDAVYVMNDNAPGTVSVIDAATDTVTATIDVDDPPTGVAVSPDSGTVYVTDDSPYVVVIDASEVSVPTISAPGGETAASVGDTLTAAPGTWVPSTVSYQWLVDGQPISGATTSTFVVTSAQAGEQITVDVSNSSGSETSLPMSVNALPTVAPTPTPTATPAPTAPTAPTPAPKPPVQRIHVRITGPAAGATYFGAPPSPHCKTSTNTGTVRCRITEHRKVSAAGMATITYTAHAVGSGGSKVTVQLKVRTESLSLSGLRNSSGAYVVKLGATYTLKVASRTKPLYVDAAVAPQLPSGVHDWFKRAGAEHGIPVWSLRLYLHTYLSGFTTWNLGIRIGSRTQILKITV